MGEVKVPVLGILSVGGLDVESQELNPKDGQLYGFVSKFGILDALVRIDPTTAKTTYIKLNCSGLCVDLQDMAFAADVTLYFAANSDFMKVDTKSGVIKTVGNNTLVCKISVLAIDPLSGKVYGLADQGTNKGTVLYEIDKATGTTGRVEDRSLDKCSNIKGMSFDDTGTLWAADHVSGAIVKIDVATRTATAVSKTLTDAQQYGDGFEALAVSTAVTKVVTDPKAVGGDVITTGAGADHLYYAAGDGIDTVIDFDKATDVLHIAGYTADQVHIDVFGANTFYPLRRQQRRRLCRQCDDRTGRRDPVRRIDDQLYRDALELNGRGERGWCGDRLRGRRRASSGAGRGDDRLQPAPAEGEALLYCPLAASISQSM